VPNPAPFLVCNKSISADLLLSSGGLRENFYYIANKVPKSNNSTYKIPQIQSYLTKDKVLIFRKFPEIRTQIFPLACMRTPSRYSECSPAFMQTPSRHSECPPAFMQTLISNLYLRFLVISREILAFFRIFVGLLRN